MCAQFYFEFSHITLELFSLVCLHFVSLFFPFSNFIFWQISFLKWLYIYVLFFSSPHLFNLIPSYYYYSRSSPYSPLPDRHGTIGNILKTYTMYHYRTIRQNCYVLFLFFLRIHVNKNIKFFKTDFHLH